MATGRFIPALAIAGSLAAGAGQSPAISDEVRPILESAASYLEDYERDVAAVVGAETYVQRVPPEGTSRTLKSDLVIVAEPNEGWVEYRDVYERDRDVVRDHDDRVAALFMKPNPNAAAQARRIADESARFNLMPRRVAFQRNINVPFTALRFLRRVNQPRSYWVRDRSDTVAGRRAEVLSFNERAMPRLIGTKQDVGARGLFWIDRETGAVLRTELRMPGATVRAVITVSYKQDPALKLWLPDVMTEQYLILASGSAIEVAGRAEYSNFRQFKVDASISIR
jgi:hypothetical protein